MDSIATVNNKSLIVSNLRRTWKRFDDLQLIFHPLMQLSKPIGLLSYMSLQANSFMVTGISVGRIMEAISVWVDRKRGCIRQIEIVKDYSISNVLIRSAR